MLRSDFLFLKPVTSSLAVQPGDRILICSDGLTGPVDDGEISGLLARGAGVEAIADSPIALANDRGGPDNITVVVMRIGKGGTAETLMRRQPPSEVDTLVEVPTVTGRQRAVDDAWAANESSEVNHE